MTTTTTMDHYTRDNAFAPYLHKAPFNIYGAFHDAAEKVCVEIVEKVCNSADKE